MHQLRWRSVIALAFALLAGVAGGAQGGTPADPEIEERAMAVLERVAQVLAQAQRFSVTVDIGYDVVQDSGEKIEFGETRTIVVRRPDHIRIDTVGGGGRSFSHGGAASGGSLGGGRFGGGQAAQPQLSRSGPARSGSLQANRASMQAGRQASREQGQASRRAALGERQTSRQVAAEQRQSERQATQGEHQQSRQASTEQRQTQRQSTTEQRQSERRSDTEQMQQQRQQSRDEAREDWQQAGRERRDSWQDYADDNDWDWDDDDWDDHPFATGMAVAAFRSLTCPPPVTVGGVPYYQCGGTWYSPAYQGGNVTYVVVNPPPGY